MAVKLKYKKSTNELETPGFYDEVLYTESAGIGTVRKGKLLNDDGTFIGTEWSEDEDILYGNPGLTPDLGNFSTPYSRSTQSNISITTRDLATRHGNRYGFVIHRYPNIASTLTWGGVNIVPPPDLMRVSGARFRFSFDYRGYSIPYNMEVYQSFSTGWSSYSVGLPTPWSSSVSSFDTDWEWRKKSYDFNMSDTYLNWIPGSNQQVWDPTVQYTGSWYGVTHNGYLYRHVNGKTSTIGVTPDQEYASDRSKVWDLKWPMTPGYANLYSHIKIGFSYQAQNSRGTHVHIDNIRLTNISNGNSFRYDIEKESWFADTLVERGVEVLLKGTAYVMQVRSDSGADIFAVEGNRYLSLNGNVMYDTGGRGLRLAVFDASGTVSFQQTYDVHGSGAECDNLYNKLISLSSNDYWSLSSHEAIGDESRHNANPSLRNLLVTMGSRMWNPNDNIYLWEINSTAARNTYAAVGIGGRLKKEDGSNGSDTRYKRKAVIQLNM